MAAMPIGGLMVLDGGKLPVEDAVVETMEVALLHPAGIDSVSLTGDTALHVASLGYDRVVRLLAERGASLNIKNGRGLTPLAILTRRNPADSNTVELLRK
jgi:ankyrin repeat protein